MCAYVCFLTTFIEVMSSVLPTCRASTQAMVPCLFTLGFRDSYREQPRHSAATKKSATKSSSTTLASSISGVEFAETSRHIVQACCYCFLSSFMFGWHVHEKAILHVVVPMVLLLGGERKHDADADAEYRENRRDYVILSIAGYYALLPLLFREDEYLMKVSVCVCVCRHLCTCTYISWVIIRLRQYRARRVPPPRFLILIAMLTQDISRSRLLHMAVCVTRLPSLCCMFCFYCSMCLRRRPRSRCWRSSI